MSVDDPTSGASSPLAYPPDDVDLVRLAGRLARCAGWSMEVPSARTYWTEELFTLLGYAPSAGPPPYEIAIGLYPDGHREVVEAAVERCQMDGTRMDVESAIVARDGEQLRVRIIADAVRDDSGEIVRIQGAFYDITEIVTERESRIAAQESLRTTLEYLPDVLVFVDESWHITYVNQAAITMADLPLQRLYSETVWNLFPELTGTVLRPIFERAMNDRMSGTGRDFLKQIGIWVEVTAHPVEGGVALFARNVTEDEERRHRMETVSMMSREQAALLDASNEAMIMEDLDNVVTYWNQGAEQIYGWSKDEAIGRNIRDLVYADAAVFDEPAAALLRDGSWRGEMVQRTKYGRTVIIECRWQAVLDSDGRPVKLFAVNSDVTAQRTQQELQSRTKRMESLGTLAGGIAHDLNNVLTPILMSVQLMRTEQSRDDRELMLAGIEVAVKRGADMINQVLSFARGVDGVRDIVDLAGVVRELFAVSLQTLPTSITVTTNLEQIPPIIGDKTQVLQVLMNLVANARDAVEGTGTITLSVSRRATIEADRATTTLEPGAYAVISVEDSGMGMSREVLDRIFEPFFTTKEQGKGTGQGLASSLAIVKSHGGTILAYSEPGKGSRLTVYLPLAEELPTSLESALDDEPLPEGSGELVLVVDDEPAIRRLVRSTLEAHGYRVVEASNGREAIDLFEGHAADAAVMFTDVMMPVMDGSAAAEYFLQHHPHVAIVVTSGLNEPDRIARAGNSGIRHFVSKPFTTQTLLRTVHAALSE